MGETHRFVSVSTSPTARNVLSSPGTISYTPTLRRDPRKEPLMLKGGEPLFVGAKTEERGQPVPSNTAITVR